MASFDSSPSEADRMAQGACDGVETTGLDYVCRLLGTGGFNGTGPDSARHCYQMHIVCTLECTCAVETRLESWTDGERS